jgi:nitrogen-specific signal transduction histidine kinase
VYAFKALVQFQSQMQSVELVKDFESDMPPIHADYAAIEQLCIHLVMKALQATYFSGIAIYSLARTPEENSYPANHYLCILRVNIDLH